MKVAITGIIGSGKSEVSKILREKGECVLSADEINAKLLTDSDYLKKLNKVFPETFIDGSFDKKKLSSIVFSDEKELEKLNALAHPEIMKTMFRLASEKELVFCEIPLLRDEWVEFFDYVWIVSCDSEEKRIERICNRDGRSLEQAKQMIKWYDEKVREELGL